VDWRTALVLISAVAIVVATVVFVLLYRRRGRRLDAALVEVERQKRNVEAVEYERDRLLDRIKVEGMTDDELDAELGSILSGDPGDDDGDGAGDGGPQT
jgi:anti-sigma-K factor RskA